MGGTRAHVHSEEILCVVRRPVGEELVPSDKSLRVRAVGKETSFHARALGEFRELDMNEPEEEARMLENEGVHVQERERCLLCGERGNLLYTGLRDRLFHAPGVWQLLRCVGCGLAWLTPQPVREDVDKLYADYYTHDAVPIREWDTPLGKIKRALLARRFGCRELLPSGLRWRVLGRVAAFVPLVRDLAGLSVMLLSGRGVLLDVGCGDGSFLARMRNLGWHVLGLELDREAASGARKRYGLPVVVTRLEEVALSTESVDVVTLSHVIEHLYDPLAGLTECWRLLRKGGRLVVVTPNTDSLGHRFFRNSWRPLEPPRHLYLFNERALCRSVQRAGFQVDVVRTSSRGARFIHRMSRDIQQQGFSTIQGGYRSKLAELEGWAFRFSEEILCVVRRPVGEELVLMATKPGGASSPAVTPTRHSGGTL
jgi:2-polyprenyl-3-methyl-5-hydroxy-6-metoxy-1,4-benzoquinol methylase